MSNPNHGRVQSVRTLRRKSLVVVLVGMGVLLVSACATEVSELSLDTSDVEARTTSKPDPRDGFSFTGVALFPPADTVETSIIGTAEQVGSVPVTVEVATRDGGEILVAKGRDEEPVFDFPEFSAQASPPRAVLRVTPVEGPIDLLAPGDADFTFGADFRKDLESEGSEFDSGDNLIQRGLASDPSQYKIEIDRGRPACAVTGSEGMVQAKIPELVVNDVSWYSIRCSRAGDSVELEMIEYTPSGGIVSRMAVENGPIGSVAWPRPQTPLAIGGKLAANGGIIDSATDQFNGEVSRPFFENGGSTEAAGDSN